MRNPGKPGFRGGEGRPRSRSERGRGGGPTLAPHLDGCERRLLRASGAPHPRPLPATRFARGGRGEEASSAWSYFAPSQRYSTDLYWLPSSRKSTVLSSLS